MQTRRFKVLLEWDAEARAWVTYVPLLGNLSTFGDTREEAIEQTREAILGYLEAADKEGIPVPDESSTTEVVDLEVSVA
jgi:predicted RNase H-like HicB family nuclease